jgi:hypothetical protein
MKLSSVILLLFVCCGSLSGGLYGQSYLKMTDGLEAAYEDITSLRMESGKQKMLQVRLKEPQNVMTYYIENYIDFFTLFIQEDPQLYKKLLPNRNIRLQKIKSGNASSPYYLFCQAEIILQWATIKLKFDDKIGAAKDVYDAYKLLEENKEMFPDFIENNKSLSIIHALAESVPSWVRKIMGIQGSVALGTKEIAKLAEKVATKDHMFKNEIVAIYSYILFYSNNKREEAYLLYDKYQLNHKSSPLIAFLKATMAHKTGRNEDAIRILEERPKTAAHIPFYYLDFIYGKYKLYRLDQDADVYINIFLKHFKGRHYIKEAYQKLAWYHLVVRNDAKSYQKNMILCQSKGNKLIDEDIQAEKDATSKSLPDQILLKARMLYDGGYYAKAQKLLVLNAKKYSGTVHDGEYYYRFGRVLDGLKNYKEALEYYEATMVKADPEKYYGCSAALYAGLISEEQKNYKKARSYFQKCLDANPAGYSSSLHQKAKSGIDRLKNK